MKRFLSLVMVCLLCLGLAGCGSKTADLEAEITRLKQENNALTEQVAQLQEQLSALKNTSLARWSLRGYGTDDESTATVSAEFWPMDREPGQSAQLLVRLDGQEAAREDCTWDGECYRAAVTLLPADGYGYYCVLTADSNQEEIPLSTPENPAEPKLTYLAGSLTAYASALAANTQVEDGILGAEVTAVVQTPLLTVDGQSVTVVLAKLCWYQGDALLSEQVLELGEGETEGSYTASLHTQLEAPELSDGDRIDLILKAELSNGRVLTAEAGSWTAMDGRLESSVG